MNYRARKTSLVPVLAAFAAALIPAAALADDAPPRGVPGYARLNGVYVPNEPHREGRPRATGLAHAWPKMQGVDRNPVTPEKVELGRLLFFDPVLSGDNSISCAHCHHPDLGLADGRKLGMGFGGAGFGPARTGGKELPRNIPTLWNAAYNRLQYSDGRADDLEAQAIGPITTAEEMNQMPGKLSDELRAIPEYVDLFARAFPGSPGDNIMLENVIAALASFERTLLSFNSKFDRYAAGDRTALDAHEKNGLKVFRSLNTRCFECHTFPTFTDQSFRVIGVPEDGEPDLGRGKISPQGPDHGFKVPSLRNVELTAPYMHNGRFATLEEVVDFYSKGGGKAEAKPIEGIDDKIQKFEITDEEKADLVSFLKALTDTSLLPEIPDRVPSGLPVVESKARGAAAPERSPILNLTGNPRGERRAGSGPPKGAPPELVAAAVGDSLHARLRSLPGAPPPASEPRPAPPERIGATFHVWPGQSIQEGINRAQAGDRIEVYPGVYNETLTVEKDGLTLIGVAVGGEKPVLDGGGTLERPALVKAEKFLMDGFEVRNYTQGELGTR